jgi:hypothetical protein
VGQGRARLPWKKDMNHLRREGSATQLGSRLIKSTIQERRPSRASGRIGLRCA